MRFIRSSLSCVVGTAIILALPIAARSQAIPSVTEDAAATQIIKQSNLTPNAQQQAAAGYTASRPKNHRFLGIQLPSPKIDISRTPGFQVGRLLALCISQISKTGKCIIDARDPAHPNADPKTVGDLLNGLSEPFSTISVPTSFPTDMPTGDPIQQRMTSLQGTIDAVVVSAPTPGPMYTPNASLETALAQAGSASASPIASPTPIDLPIASLDHAIQLDLKTTITPPSGTLSSNTAVFGTSVDTAAILTINLMVGKRQFNPSPITLADLDMVALYGGVKTKPSLELTASIFNQPGTNLIDLPSVGAMKYANASVAQHSEDLCNLSNRFPVIQGVDITVSFQCEISMGYGAYIDVDDATTTGRVRVVPALRAYLIGNLDASLLSSLVKVDVNGKFSLLSIDGAAGVYMRPVHDPIVGGAKTFLVIEPYEYASADFGASLITLSVHALNKQITFILGSTPAKPVIEFPSDPSMIGGFYAIPIPTIATPIPTGGKGS